jgi:rhodanese-related sulfurtransferase
VNRCTIRFLFPLIAVLCPAVTSSAQPFGHSLKPAALYGRAADGNGAARKVAFVLSGSGERRPLGVHDDRVIGIGSWLLPGRILDNQLQMPTRLKHFAGGALVAAGLTLLGFVCWKRRALRRRIWSSRISPEELHDMMSSGHTPLIIDLRSPLDMLADPRMIPGAIRLTREEISAAASTLPHDCDLVLYCTCPNQESSIDVALKLRNMGFTRIRLLSGGFHAWKQLGYKLHDASDKIHWRLSSAFKHF